MFGFGIYKKSHVETDRKLFKNDQVVIQKLKLDIMHLEESRDVVEYIKSIKDEPIIDIVQNKYQELYALTKRESDKSMTITMKSPYTKQYPDVFVTLDRDIRVDEGVVWVSNQKVFIESIHAINKRHGNGRILINTVISYAKEQQYKVIEGRITDDDRKATPGLPDFYKGMGFTLNKEESYFKMKL